MDYADYWILQGYNFHSYITLYFIMVISGNVLNCMKAIICFFFCYLK
jgi:hypothetical protein